jgi:hypothetical protein
MLKSRRTPTGIQWKIRAIPRFSSKKPGAAASDRANEFTMPARSIEFAAGRSHALAVLMRWPNRLLALAVLMQEPNRSLALPALM